VPAVPAHLQRGRGRHPRLKTPTRAPRSLRNCTIHSTNGVFPVPPAEMFPTQITGTAARAARNHPRSYATLRAETTAP
jgi:hypothetical protein